MSTGKEKEENPIAETEENDLFGKPFVSDEESEEQGGNEEAIEKESPSASQYGSFPPVSEKDKKKKAKTSVKVAKALRYGLLATAATLFIGTYLVATNFFVTTPTVSMDSLSVSENTISYELSIANESKIQMSLSFEGNGKTYTYDVSESKEYQSTVSELDYDTEYLVKVKGVERNSVKTYYTSTIHTPAYVKRTAYYGLSWNCHCLVDGYATYTLDIANDFSYWSNYRFVFIKNDEKVFSLYNVEVGTHDVYVLDKSGGLYTLSFVVDSIDPGDSPGGGSIEKTIASIEAGI